MKTWNLDRGIGRQGGGKFKQRVRFCIVEGRGGSLIKENDFRSWHCGRQGGRKNLNKGIRF